MSPDSPAALSIIAPRRLSCSPNVQHYLRNTSDALFRGLFTKAPGISSDKVDAEWEPAKEAE